MHKDRDDDSHEKGGDPLHPEPCLYLATFGARFDSWSFTCQFRLSYRLK